MFYQSVHSWCLAFLLICFRIFSSISATISLLVEFDVRLAGPIVGLDGYLRRVERGEILFLCFDDRYTAHIMVRNNFLR
jgi:hypothetical protein